MKQKWYRGEIIKRFMSEKEQREFDQKYKESTLVRIGSNFERVILKPKAYESLLNVLHTLDRG